MKKSTFALLLCFLLGVFSPLGAQTGTIKIVVLGSSTAVGTGTTNPDFTWVNRYRKYVKSMNFSSEVINLAYGGYTTYKLMPDNFIQPVDRPAPDPNHNITKALSLSPNVIIVNLPSNDVASGYSLEEQMANYDTIIHYSMHAGVPIYITTTQPRNMSADLMQLQMDARDSINKYLGERAIDFWTDLANEDGTINSFYDAGDGTHLNDTAHYLLATRVIAKNILSHSISDNPIDTIHIDLGSVISPGNWNNLTNAVTSSVGNLVNSRGQSTGISISITDALTGINTQGAPDPDPSTGFDTEATSDSFFGSVGEHSGIYEPTGALTLSGLKRSTLYSFTFFASRMGAADNREAQYTVIGTNKDSAYLNASENTTQVVTISNIQSAENGTITIKVAPGPNNDNEKKYYYIGAVRIVAEKQEVVIDPKGTIRIDFGSTVSSGTWNNLTLNKGNETITDLVNTEGNSTGIAVWVHDAFTGINTGGTTTPDASLDFDPNASSDSFFGSEGEHSGVIEPTGGITIAGLKQDAVYTLTFFASRMSTSDNRETLFKVEGKKDSSVYLDPANNTANVVHVEYMRPDPDGVIRVTVSPGPNNTSSVKYYYMGILQIDYKDSIEVVVGIPGIPDTGNDLISMVYPTPFYTEATIGYTIPAEGRVQVTIYNQLGQVEKILVDQNQMPDSYMVKWTPETKKNGVFLCQIRLTTSGKVFSNIQRIVAAP
ncbi:MAG: SGNH/GDSL hydrolase family protein [Bacteroidales bacterium]